MHLGGLLALLAVQIDWTVRIGDVVTLMITAILIPAFLAFGRALFSMRDSVVKLVENMGSEQPTEGVLGDLVHVKRELRRHRDWLIRADIIDPSDRT